MVNELNYTWITVMLCIPGERGDVIRSPDDAEDGDGGRKAHRALQTGRGEDRTSADFYLFHTPESSSFFSRDRKFHTWQFFQSFLICNTAKLGFAVYSHQNPISQRAPNAALGPYLGILRFVTKLRREQP